jgi:secreted trypsin-like serine protease
MRAFRPFVGWVAVVLLVAGLGAPAAGADGAARPRVVGGSPVADGAYPFAAMIRVRTRHEGWTCGGTLVAADKVLTAGHCVTGKHDRIIGPAAFTVVVGRTERGTSSGEERRVNRVDRHPAYDNRGSLPNDVAVLTLSAPVSSIDPIALPAADDRSREEPGQDAVVVGWGLKSVRGRSAKRLREVTLDVLSIEDCRRRFGRYAGDILDGHLCAFAPRGDSCQGDSGGPLFVDGGTGAVPRYVQLGVVSWGIGCADGKHPGIYTRLSDPVVAAFVAEQIDPSPRSARR